MYKSGLVSSKLHFLHYMIIEASKTFSLRELPNVTAKMDQTIPSDQHTRYVKIKDNLNAFVKRLCIEFLFLHKR